MDWSHDPDGEVGSEGKRKYGMAILAKKVDEEDFPLSKEAFLEEHARDPIRLNHRRVVSVQEIFEYVEADEFEDALDFHQEVGEAMRAGGFWEYHPEGERPERKSA